MTPDDHAAPVEFLTPEWAAALERAANGSESLREAAAGLHLTVQQQIGDTAYAVEFADGSVRVHWGPVEGADVTFVQSRDTAAAIGQGSINAQQAFMAGTLRVRGDLSRLTEARAALLRLDDVFAGVRARTRY